MLPETIFTLLAYIMMATANIQYTLVRLPTETFALYMNSSCSMLNESFQPLPLPFAHYVILPCPYIKKNSHRNLKPCITTKSQELMCWTNRIPPHIKIICPDCTYGLVYHHKFDYDYFKYALAARFPIVNTIECNHRNFRYNPNPYPHAPKKPKIAISKPIKNPPKARPGAFKQSYR